MAKQSVYYELIIAFIYIMQMLLVDTVDVLPFVFALLFYGILKASQLILSIYYPKTYLLKILILIYLLIVQVFVSPMRLFLVLNIMMLHQLQRGIRYVLSSVLIIVILISSGQSDLSLISVSTLTAIGISLIEILSRKLEVNRRHIQELSSQMDQMKMAIVLNRRHEDEISTISRLEERQNIAQQLHDKLGHVLSGNIIQLEAIQLLMDHDLDKAKDRTVNVMGNLRSGMDDIRSLLKSMKPESANMSIGRIKTILSETEKLSGIQMNLSYDDSVNELNYRLWKVIITNIQESLTNMMKYSEASRCTISFTKLNRMLRIAIEDNGKGCQHISKGLGLQGMEERLEQVNGQLIVDGKAGFKTVMLIELGGKTDEG